jgi:chromosome segregation ATPase
MTPTQQALQAREAEAEQAQYAAQGDMLVNSVSRVSSSLATLERLVESVIANARDTKQNAEKFATGGLNEEQLIATLEKWRTRYADVEKERDELQEMLVALKTRYEEIVRHNAALIKKSEQQEADYMRLLDTVDEVSGRLDISLGLIEEVLEHA